MFVPITYIQNILSADDRTIEFVKILLTKYQSDG